MSCLEERGEISEEEHLVRTSKDAQEPGRLNRALEIYILLSWDFLSSKAFGFREHREGWRPDDPLRAWSTVAEEGRENEARALAAEPKKRTLPRQGDLPRRRGFRGWAPFAWAAFADLLVAGMPLGWEPASPKPSEGCSQHWISEDVAYFTYKPHCN